MGCCRGAYPLPLLDAEGLLSRGQGSYPGVPIPPLRPSLLSQLFSPGGIERGEREGARGPTSLAWGPYPLQGANGYANSPDTGDLPLSRLPTPLPNRV